MKKLYFQLQLLKRHAKLKLLWNLSFSHNMNDERSNFESKLLKIVQAKPQKKRMKITILFQRKHQKKDKITFFSNLVYQNATDEWAFHVKACNSSVHLH